MPIQALCHKTGDLRRLHGKHFIRFFLARNAAKTHAPDPVILASPKVLSQSRHSQPAGTSGTPQAPDHFSTAEQAFRSPLKSPTFDWFRIACQFPAGKNLYRGYCTGGTSTTYQAGGSATGWSFSPTPSAKALSPNTNTGTSAPRRKPSSCNIGRLRFRFHKRFSASSVVAASELPRPSRRPSANASPRRYPRPDGIRFPAAADARRAPLRSCSGSRPGSGFIRRITPSSRIVKKGYRRNRRNETPSAINGSRPAAGPPHAGNRFSLAGAGKVVIILETSVHNRKDAKAQENKDRKPI